jgi:acetyl esterase/lipase
MARSLIDEEFAPIHLDLNPCFAVEQPILGRPEDGNAEMSRIPTPPSHEGSIFLLKNNWSESMFEVFRSALQKLGHASAMTLQRAMGWVVAMTLTVPAPTRAEEPRFLKHTYTYKTIDKLEIQADVYREKDEKVRPVVVWIHGGALIVGNRHGVPHDLLQLCRKEGYALVALDYRLAPETKLSAIIEDIKDAFRWIRSQGPELFHINPDRIVVTGGSAGGYLTMMTGICVEPRPRALVAYWGYGDVDGPWYVKPSEHYRTTTALIDKEEAYKAVGKKVTTGAELSSSEMKARGRFYLYLRQNGLWTKVVSGFDPAKGPRKLDPFCPVRNIKRDYPPILMIHGTKDTDVPYQESADMAKELARQKRAYELITVSGAGHGLAGGNKKVVREAHERALDFIRRHMK